MKQAILVRADLKLPKGKLAAQCGHAAVGATMNSDKKKVAQWLAEGAAKIVLKVADKKELLHYLQLAKDAGIKTALITDAGKTVVAPGTMTCLGMGPDEDEKVDVVIGKLKLL